MSKAKMTSVAKADGHSGTRSALGSSRHQSRKARGHIAGGIGGAAAALAFTSLRRTPALATATVAAIGAISVAVALYTA